MGGALPPAPEEGGAHGPPWVNSTGSRPVYLRGLAPLGVGPRPKAQGPWPMQGSRQEPLLGGDTLARRLAGVEYLTWVFPYSSPPQDGPPNLGSIAGHSLPY